MLVPEIDVSWFLVDVMDDGGDGGVRDHDITGTKGTQCLLLLGLESSI